MINKEIFMTYEMEYAAYLFACGARGEKAKPPKQPVDWEKVVQIAVDQSITYTVAMAIKNNELGCPDSTRNRLIGSLRGAAVKNSIKIDGILDLVSKLEEEGIRVLIIKGIDVARWYANPECRVSSDTDLLIAPENEEKAYKVLTDFGFQMQERKKNSNHGIGYHPVLGTVELHVQLMQDSIKNSIVKDWDVDDRAMRMSEKQEYLGRTYYAMEPTDNLLFLTYHMLKHFIYNGMSLRMMMDNALFAKQHLQSIDRERYAESLKKTNYINIMRLLFGAMVKYCGFVTEDFPIEPLFDDEQIDLIMTDLEESGWQGLNNEKERVEAWLYYRLKNAKDTNDRDEIHEIKKEIRSDYYKSLFPSMKRMSEKYPSLKEHKWQYPFCWTHRFFTKGISLFFSFTWKDQRGETDENKLSDGAQRKLELFKSVGLIS